MLSKTRFLVFLWVFIAADVTFFQNATTHGSAAELHNDLCKQSQDLNESRILQTRAIQNDLMSLWPKNTNTPSDDMKATSDLRLDVNKQMYDVCLADKDATIRTSENYALTEMKKLADPDSNHAWKSYVGVLENTIESLKKGPL